MPSDAEWIIGEFLRRTITTRTSSIHVSRGIQYQFCSRGQHVKDEDLYRRDQVRDAMGGNDQFKLCVHCKVVFWFG